MDDLSFFELKLTQDGLENLLNEHRKEKRFIDVILKVGDQTFDAHRNVLSLYSPVLEEAISDQSSMICPISDQYVNPEIVEDLLNFLYTGYIKLTPDNVYPLCVAAHFLKIQTLLEPSVEYLCRQVTVENVLTLFQFSSSCQLELLNKRCLPIIFDNYETILQSDQILQFLFEDFNDLILGMKVQFRGIIPVQVYHCVVRWTDKNFIERSSYFPILLKNIPLKGLPSDFIAETVLQSDQILQFPFDDFNDVIGVLKKQSSGTVGEQTFHCIVRWTESNLVDRSNHLPILLKNIPLAKLPPIFLAETVLQSDHILQFPFKDFKDVIVDRLKVHSAAVQKETFHCVVRWLERNIVDGSNRFLSLLKCILLETLPSKSFTETALQSDQILEFSFEDFKDVIVGMRMHFSGSVRVQIFHCIIRWTEKNPIRKHLEYLPILLQNIPLEELPSKFLVETVLQSDHILQFSFDDFNNVIGGLKTHFSESVREQTFHCIFRWAEENLERLIHLPILLKDIPLQKFSSRFLAEKVLKNDHILQFWLENFKEVIDRLKLHSSETIQEQLFHYIVRWSEENLHRRNHLLKLLKSVLLETLPSKSLAETVLQSDQIIQFTYDDLKDVIVGLKWHPAGTVREQTFHCIVRWTGKNSQDSIYLSNLLREISLKELSSKFLAETVLRNKQILLFPLKDFNDVIVRMKVQIRGRIRECFEQVFNYIIRWIEKKTCERLKHLPTLLEAISLEKLPTKFLEEKVSVHPLVKESTSCQQTVSAILKTRIDNDVMLLENSESCQHLRQNMIVINPLMTNREPGLSSMSCYDPFSGLWSKLEDGPYLHGYNYVATVINQRDIIVCDRSCKDAHSLEMFDWNKQTWTKLPTPSFSLKSLSLSAHNGRLYLTGSRTKSNSMICLCYNFETNQWKKIDSLRKETFDSGHLISCNNYLYAIGGSSFKIARYDPEQDLWINLVKFAGSRRKFKYSAVSHRGKIYLSSFEKFEVFDPETNKLTNLPKPIFHQLKGLVSMNEHLLAVGRQFIRGINTPYCIFEYDFSNRNWFVFDEVPNRQNFGSVLLTVG